MDLHLSVSTTPPTWCDTPAQNLPDCKNSATDKEMANSCVFDSTLFKNAFGTEEIRSCFSESSYVSNLIDVECALAQAEAIEGVIPHDAGMCPIHRRAHCFY